MSYYHKNVKPLFLHFASMPLAIALLVVLSIASMIGTVLLQNQDHAGYLDQFGPVWYWVFRSLGLFDMYHAWWFTGLLGFLMVTLSFCLWHNIPRMLKEMRSRKITLADRAWKRMQYHHERTLTGVTIDQMQEKIQDIPGWKWLSQQEGEKVHLRGDKGHYHKWGYILVHSSLLVILVGGWMSVQFGFNGNMPVPEGQSESQITFVEGTGIGSLDMPFEVRCNEFEIDFFHTGMPKLFRSNLTIIDGGKEVLTADIEVNKPLYYKGVHIYQASFGDAGSKLKFNLFRLDGTQTVDTAEVQVYQTYTDPVSGVSMEIVDFKPYNVENLAEDGEPKRFQDLGPAVDLIFRGPGLQPVKVRSFMNPFILNGQNQGMLMMVSMSGEDRDFQTFFLGLDFSQPEEWQLFHAFEDLLSTRSNPEPEANLEAFRNALKEVYGDDKPEDIQGSGLRTLQAINMLSSLPWPFVPVLQDYEQLYYTGLQLASDPGMNVVWVGSALLTLGLCIMLYVSHRKMWLLFESKEGGVHLRVAGLSNRNAMAFEQEFNEFLRELDESLTVSKQGEST